MRTNIENPRNRSNRLAIVLSAAALVTSIGIAGGPAIAGVIASNSDKVDGLHAVKASATKAQAKGKLVATNPTTAIFPSKFIGNDVKFTPGPPRSASPWRAPGVSTSRPPAPVVTTGALSTSRCGYRPRPWWCSPAPGRR